MSPSRRNVFHVASEIVHPTGFVRISGRLISTYKTRRLAENCHIAPPHRRTSAIHRQPPAAHRLHKIFFGNTFIRSSDTRNDMPVQCTYILVLLSTVFVYSSMAHPFARKRQEMRASWCESCGNEEECEQCKYGPVYSSFCGGYVCGKGPGEKCGGPDDSIWGECGDGLSCSCNICTGCSLTTYDCLPDTCPPQEKPRPPHITFDIQLYSPSELK